MMQAKKWEKFYWNEDWADMHNKVHPDWPLYKLKRFFPAFADDFTTKKYFFFRRKNKYNNNIYENLLKLHISQNDSISKCKIAELLRLNNL